MIKKSSLLIFFKAQASAFIGGIVDYIIMILCTEWLGIYYPISILISGMIGAVVNFSINRHWTYQSIDKKIRSQLFRFAIVVIGSVILKSVGTYTFTTLLRVDYKIGRVITDLIVSLGFNYTLQTYWVFRKGRITNDIKEN